MKQTMKNAAIGLVTLLAVTTGFTASATDKTAGAELKIAGQLNNQPVFQLNLNNQVNNKFVIRIKDEFGTLLHEETVSGVNISRNFQFDSEELDGITIRIEILDVKNSTTAVFNVKNNTRVVAETSIVKS